MLVGLTAYSTRQHIVRAALESAAFQVKQVLDAMLSDSAVAFPSLKVDGGMTQNNVLMQFQADILGVPLHRPKVAETTALGVAFAAGLGVGFWSSQDELRALCSVDTVWTPTMPVEKSVYLVKQWEKAVSKSFDWV